METPADPESSRRAAGLWSVATLGLLAAGWATFFLTQAYAFRLMERYGPAPDVVDALGRDAYIDRRTLPYYSVMILLDLAAVLTLAAPSRAGWPRILKILAAVVLAPTVLLHGLVWVVTGFLFTG
jgi:hypothetical protein